MKLLLIISIFVLSLFANDADKLKEVVQTKSDIVVSILKNENLTKDAKFKQINDAVDNLFDYKLIAKLSLGKKGYRLLDKEQRKLFIELFTKDIKNFYFEKSDLLSDKKIVVTKAIEKRGRIFVVSEIVDKKDTNELIYKFYKTKQKNYLIYDVEIAGVSIIKKYKAQFQEILAQNDVKKLFEYFNK